MPNVNNHDDDVRSFTLIFYETFRITCNVSVTYSVFPLVIITSCTSALFYAPGSNFSKMKIGSCNIFSFHRPIISIVLLDYNVHRF